MTAVRAPVRFTVGVDLGKLSDYSALALVEERAWQPPRNYDDGDGMPAPVWGSEPIYRVTWLRRWPLRTKYLSVARDVALFVSSLLARRPERVDVALDATGVGVAVSELFRREPTIADRLTEVTITTGLAATRVSGGWHVPKRDLVAVVQTLLGAERLRIAAGLPEAGTLTSELREFEATYTPSANLTFSHRDGAHDDLLLAAATALWLAERNCGPPPDGMFADFGQPARSRIDRLPLPFPSGQ